MRTSSSRSLALTCLYSLYSTASGERSSFCTFLWEQDNKHEETDEGWVVENLLWECLFIMLTLLWNLNKCSLFLPSILSEELVLELFQVLAESLLLLSGLLELLQKFLPVRESVEKFQNLTGIFESTLMVYYTVVEESKSANTTICVQNIT